ncbi:glycosyltransferase family 4 protein [Lichenihabitans sp. Uapishka_5]|uniref:glycosyltransferase family 4 protein n=1 Tax=Lichenihabitans sp. Uapishka_5 TaxID=3037302 RepID=UPI0029E7CDD9|nr:glycosyltransferase family 4 protein [Lichenihabitans sp. Uapishka_5]MDX7950621.1 glycosyltransferase family 4 protein [Lichenihabitans sp. Uapishka_5]
MRIAFYAPLKAPDHPVPSGDRTMARALIAALRKAGHVVEQPSGLRSFLPTPDPDGQAALLAEATAEQARVASAWTGEAPDLWFTYHNHYKAPDLIGPALAQHFGSTYVLAEASHAPKRAATWGAWHAAAEAASRAADLHVCFTPRDRLGLLPLVKPGASTLLLPPFIDVLPTAAGSTPRQPGPARLVTVAMMRPGDKLDSYRFLAEALAILTDRAWHLDVVGDGPARAAVQACFAACSADRITWHGELGRDATQARLAAADIFVWPGFGEAFGLAYLEAQAAGVPVVALDTAGVGSVVQAGDTGILIAEASVAAYGQAVRRLLDDTDAITRMGGAARHFVTSERTLDGAAAILDKGLREARHGKACRHG